MSCAKTAPQRPSQRSGQTPPVDTTLLAMMEVNGRLVEEADRIVALWVQEQVHHFNLMECGAWRIERDSLTSARAQHETNPQSKETWFIRWQVYHLDGSLAEDHEGTYTIGRAELPAAVDETVQQMIHSEKTTIIAPWYCVYGIKGSKHIQPYENVRIDIQL